MRKTTCDICGKEINEYAFHYCREGGRLGFINVGEARCFNSNNTFDLCGECCEKVVRFIDDGGERYNDT